MKALLLCILLSATAGTYAQEKTTTGLLLLSLNRTESSFDLFFPCKIDSTRSLKENILKAQPGTSFLAIIDSAEVNEMIPFADKLRNEALASKITDELEYILVIPVEVSFGNTKPVFAKNDKDFFLDWPVEFYKQTLFESYNAKQKELKNVRVIRIAD
jgi:hypothetical protein